MSGYEVVVTVVVVVETAILARMVSLRLRRFGRASRRAWRKSWE